MKKPYGFRCFPIAASMRFWHTHWTDGWTPAWLDATLWETMGWKPAVFRSKMTDIYTSYMSVYHVHPWVGVKSSEILQYYRYLKIFSWISKHLRHGGMVCGAKPCDFMDFHEASIWAMPKCQQGDPVTRSWSVGCFAPAWTVAPGLQGLVRMVQKWDPSRSQGSAGIIFCWICWKGSHSPPADFPASENCYIKSIGLHWFTINI